MNNTNSCGYDDIPITVIKSTIQLIAGPLAHIMYRSFTEGKFPSALKIALVKPLHKKGDVDDVNNYRPISLLSSFAKIFERLLVGRLCSFMYKYNIFSTKQHGFLKNRSTTTAMFELVSDILEALESDEVPIGLFLDLSKAFDSVNHERLLKKLSLYGIRDCQLHLIQSYLSNRIQRVCIDNGRQVFISEDKYINIGVPQGSSLGPFLFLMYINDLDLLLFVDDANALVRCKNLGLGVEQTQLKFNSVQNWCTQNKLLLNVSKTDCVIFRTIQSKVEYPRSMTLNDAQVKFLSSTNFLGISLDCHLRWNNQVNQLSRRLNSALFMIRVLSRKVDMELLKTIYHTNFVSLLRYGLVIWGGTSDLNKLFILQKYTLRAILGLKYRESCRGHFRDNFMLTLPGLYVLECLLFLKKNPQYFDDLLNTNNTRRRVPYHFPSHSLTLTERNTKYMCIRLYNKLPKYLIDLSNVKKFKKEITELIVDIEPYSIQEFMEYSFKS